MKFFNSDPVVGKKLYIFLGIAAVIFLVNFLMQRVYSEEKVILGGESFTMRVADTVSKRTRGLGGTSPLDKNEGMIFIFSQKTPTSFWMKGLSYPLDIIWVDGETIVDMAPRVPPILPNMLDADAPRYSARMPADVVLEVPAGTIDRLNIKIGDTIERE